MRLKSSRRALVAEAAHARLATPAQLQLLRAGSTARGARGGESCVLGRRQMSAHSATALGRCATSRVAAELRRFRTSVQRSFDSSVALQHFNCSLHPPRPNTNPWTGFFNCIAAFPLQLASQAPKHKPFVSVEKADGLCIAGNRLHCNGAAGTSPLQSTPWLHCRYPGCIATTQRT